MRSGVVSVVDKGDTWVISHFPDEGLTRSARDWIVSSSNDDSFPHEIVPLLNDCAVICKNELAASQFCMLVENVGYVSPSSRVVVLELLDYVLNPRRTASILTKEVSEETGSDLYEFFMILSRKAAGLPLLVKQQLSALSKVDGRFGDFFSAILDHSPNQYESLTADGCASIQQLMHRVVEIPAKRNKTEGEPDDSIPDVTAILDEGGAIQSLLRGYEPRMGQLEMAASVFDALSNASHLLVEAGTGTGKSLAYLVPALQYAYETGNRVMIATHTIHLQEQLRTRDIPLLKQVMPFPFEVAVLKGRTNYLCMRKLAGMVSSTGFLEADTERQAVYWMKLLVWLLETEAGDREEIGRLEYAEPFHLVASETETCINKVCPFFRNCYYHKAKAVSQAADVIITNHSLIFTDLKTTHHVLPAYRHLILDEGHHLEDEATKHLGDSVEYFAIIRRMNQLYKDRKTGYIPQLSVAVSTTPGSPLGGEAVDELVQRLLQFRGDFENFCQITKDTVIACGEKGNEGGRWLLRIREERSGEAMWSGASSAYQNVLSAVISLHNQADRLRSAMESVDDDAIPSAVLMDIHGICVELRTAIERLQAFFEERGPTTVMWIEAEQSTRPVVHFYWAPMDVGPLLREHLFETKDSVVVTSATLTINQEFGYTVSRLGLDELSEQGTVHTLRVASPFDYAEQALVCIPGDIPELHKKTDAELADIAADWVSELAHAAGGRTLVLFTSHRSMRETHKRLGEAMDKKALVLLTDGVSGGSRHQLIARFLSEERAVLMGAASFWEGVDIPGDQLSLVIIVRLPFWPPSHPVVQARTEMIEAMGNNAFMTYSLPQAVVRFQQGFGRLIRTKTDYGAMVVLDRRVIDARYGRQFVRSLPGPRVFKGSRAAVVAQVVSWLAR